MTQTEFDVKQLLSSTMFGTNLDNAVNETAQIALDLVECNNGSFMITMDANALAAAIVEAIASHHKGYMEYNPNRNPIATQIIESVMTHLD